jgi:hypothetical protein
VAMATHLAPSHARGCSSRFVLLSIENAPKIEDADSSGSRNRALWNLMWNRMCDDHQLDKVESAQQQKHSSKKNGRIMLGEAMHGTLICKKHVSHVA